MYVSYPDIWITENNRYWHFYQMKLLKASDKSGLKERKLLSNKGNGEQCMKFHWESECVWKENECQKRPNQKKIWSSMHVRMSIRGRFHSITKEIWFFHHVFHYISFFGGAEEGYGWHRMGLYETWLFSCFSECHINTFFIEYIAQQFYKVPKNFDNAIFASIFLHYFIYFFVFSSCHSFSKFEIIPKWTRKTISREVNTFKWKASHLYLSLSLCMKILLRTHVDSTIGWNGMN